MIYRRRASPLHAARAGVAATWCVVLGLVGFSLEQPFVLAVLLGCALAAAVAAGVGREVSLSLAWGVPFALVIALINTLVTRDGLTVLVRGWELPALGRLDITLEAAVYSAILGLRFLIVICCAGLLAAAVNPDELLRAMRRLSVRSGVTAAVATRLMPVLARDARRLRGGPALPRRRRRGAGRGAARGDVRRAGPRDGRRRHARGARLRRRAATAAAAPPVVAARRRVRGLRGRARGPRHAARDRGLGGVRGAAAARHGGRRIGARARGGARGLRPVPIRPAPRGGAVSVLELDAVSYAYPGEPAALEDVSLRVAHGEFVVVSGGSGSGKSTLLRAAAGLVPHFHGGTFAGRLRCGGLDTREHGPGELAAVAGTLLQDPETQVVMGTVRAELAFPLENRGFGEAAVARGIEEAALALGIAGLLDRSTHELSGGELQRVALGAALAGRPQIVLLDEPTAQLDPVAGDELLGVLRRINEEWGTAVLLAEHRLERCLSAGVPRATTTPPTISRLPYGRRSVTSNASKSQTVSGLMLNVRSSSGSSTPLNRPAEAEFASERSTASTAPDCVGRAVLHARLRKLRETGRAAVGGNDKRVNTRVVFGWPERHHLEREGAVRCGVDRFGFVEVPALLARMCTRPATP